MFGGAFNPPTIAHIETAHTAMQAVHAEEVIYVPSKMTYIRDEQKKSFAFSDHARLLMLHQIAGHRDWMKVSDYEINSEAQPRSYRTLQYLKAQGHDCSLLFGSDKLSELETGWLFIEEIAREFGMVCMSRNGDHCEELMDSDAYLRTLKPYITIVHMPETWQTISSSRVRSALSSGNLKEAQSLVPFEIRDLNTYKEMP
jgi:nicotinate-nucleotide adenylyltransferase